MYSSIPVFHDSIQLVLEGISKDVFHKQDDLSYESWMKLVSNPQEKSVHTAHLAVYYIGEFQSIIYSKSSAIIVYGDVH